LEGQPSNEADFDLFSPAPAAVHSLLENNGFALNRESLVSYELLDLKGHKIHIVKFPFATIEEALGSFDFTARMAGTDGQLLYTGPSTLKDIRHRVIKRNKAGRFSINTTSLNGVVRYANRGYTLSYGDAQQMLEAWGATPSTEGY
jgi:hypothetical protein